ncbi:sensory neuron membrane protein 2 isoform X2 [Plodia interpunctella]|uniref:sensory neuron membrane protein 2 isoform X2 n=1 Tax=Plodia interpunctella TaxID=58824 RepID=UPI002368E99B|nr:sensory neuron membrane protein 2 isoform X2 [Plodia interpunctella]
MLRQRRVIEEFGEDYLVYRRHDIFMFDEKASYPNREDDEITITNVPFHAVLNAVEEISAALLPAVQLGITGIFGQHSAPLTTVRVRDLLFDGIPLCQNALVVSGIACSVIRSMSESLQNLQLQPDNSLRFSLMAYRNGTLGQRYNVSRGKEDIEDLGRVTLYSDQPYLSYWPNYRDELSVCNMINGTDSGLFNPFIDTSKPLYALNPDICRSVELRYQGNEEYEGIPSVRFAANEWMFDNDDGCFCLNVTRGLKTDEGCMYRGATELFSCVGAHLILSYPHFLYADPMYSNGLIGMTPNPDKHRIFLDIEPHTGVVLRGAKRAQFNVFMRSLPGIPSTANLRTTLTPIFWIEEGILLPEEYVEQLQSSLISTLSLLQILVPVAVAVCCVVFVVGIALVTRTRFRRKLSSQQPTSR